MQPVGAALVRPGDGALTGGVSLAHIVYAQHHPVSPVADDGDRRVSVAA